MSAAHSIGGDRLQVRDLSTATYRIPTETPEADGTLAWNETVLVVAGVCAGDQCGTGWTYGGDASRAVIDDVLEPVVRGRDPLDVGGIHESMVRAIRNLGRPGVAGSAVSAVDIALWDLKARLLGVSLAQLFGRCGERIAVYGSGGFTTYDEQQTTAQLRGWLESGITQFKIKVGESWGTCPERDLERVRLARRVIGDDAALFVDANGGYRRKQAVRVGKAMRGEAGISWFEEPVSSDDLTGLSSIREQLDVDVAAGEYGYSEAYFAAMVGANAVDCLQIDVTRCGGYTSWLRVASLAYAAGLDVSGHCAPSLHAHVACAVPNARHVELFYDHQRADGLLFDGVLDPAGGSLAPDSKALGHGMTLRESDARVFRTH